MSLSFEAVTLTLNPAIDLTAAVDDFKKGEVNRVKSMRSNPGGKGVNVAFDLADYGHHVAATGFLGKENAAFFESLFSEKKIACHFVYLEGATRRALKITDAIQNETTDINFPGLTPDEISLKTLHSILDALDAPWFVLGGSVAPGMPETIYPELICSLKQRGKKVALDTSGEALRQGIEAAPDLIKPNIFELEMLTGKKLNDTASVILAARSLLEKGIGQVVVSMGGKGACFVSRDETLLAEPPSIPVVSTVGAGDAMVAGLISARLSGLAGEESARLATAFSLSVLLQQGSGLNSVQSVHDFIPQIKITKF